MFIDSHCHIDFPELMPQMPEILAQMQAHKVSHALAVSVDVSDWSRIQSLIEQYPNLYGSVGTHPDYPDVHEPSIEELLEKAKHPKVIAIGETGLDYFRLEGNLEWQRERFRTHIRAALRAQKPLIIHTRNAQDDTIRLMTEENARDIGGVMHCFTEAKDVAKRALDLNFYISFSGIVSFKNAKVVHECAEYVPLERILIETDAPYLAPVPHRGQTNQPAWVAHVAQRIADIKGVSVEEVGRVTTENFKSCFRLSAL
ncbi:TatD family hydrolase [Hydromonas duriensis]|uniref:TatD DNase family protein n=1 Tax=Hydromonas duriensis TaxID=1527608 RepID=A0A4R6YB20_9BURK|nr:TatD family hydrolase [Hydromonas duriensis]TDR32792.1 TatD DNase family protein [Hydromonas duriensis]